MAYLGAMLRRPDFPSLPGRGGLVALSAAAVVAALPTAALADEDTLSSVLPAPSGVYGGQEVEACGWPTAVAVTSGGGLCTGTLVHPKVVVYAAHCGGGTKKIKFGQSSVGPNKTISANCQANPGYGGTNDQAHDWAFCVLTTPVTDLPLTPVLFGCETAALKVGADVAIVGFGANQGDTGAGTKRWGMTKLTGVFANTTTLGGGGLPSICPGDSGGPAFVKYPDGTWHAFGIASTVTGGCGGTGTHARIDKAVPWIEETSGIDITPCHDADGTWNPTYKCSNFFMGDQNGHGTWTDWCPGTPALEASYTCGDPFNKIPDNDAPLVAIATPFDGDEFLDPVPAKVTVEINADDADGWGVKQVGIKLNGVLQPITDTEPPYTFNDAVFPEGIWTIQAVAEDAAGLVGESPPVTIIVGNPPDPAGTGGTDSGGTAGTDSWGTAGTDASASGDTGGGTAASGGSDSGVSGGGGTALGSATDGGGSDMEPSGCGCRSGDGGLGGLGLAGLLLLPLVRRRRRG